jgi:hypothetical protein
MNGGIIAVIVISIILVLVGLSGMRDQHGHGGGSKGFVGGAKRNLGMMGLLVILFGSLAFSNCLALQGA